MSKWSTIIYIFYMSKTFTPFLSFMVPYLIESCKFTNKDVYNKLNPFFFISSLIMSLVSFYVVEKFGNIISLVIDTILELLVYLLFFLRPERSFLMGIVVCSLHGASTSMNSVLKNIIISTAPDRNESRKVMANTQTLKNVVNIFSSWIGQDIYIHSKEHRVNIFYSIVSLVVSLVVVTLLPHGKTLVKGESIGSYRNLGNYIMKAYDSKTLSYSLMYVSSSILSICLSFFAASIFLERKKKAESNVLFLNRITFKLMKPFRWISYCLVKFYSLISFTPLMTGRENQDIVIHGYVDGFAKLFSALLGYLITKIDFSESSLPSVSMILNIATMASLYLLGTTSSLVFSYLFFIISYSFSSAAKVLVLVLLYRNEKKSFIISLNMFFSSLIHILLSYVSLYMNCNVQTRFLLYFVMCFALVSGSVIVYKL